ncbi:MAG: hypothetical protein ACI9UA_003196, partial [Pseudoalteromonas tetraodonis]
FFYTSFLHLWRKIGQNVEKKAKKTGWQKTGVNNLTNNASGVYYARFKVGGKQVWRSLKKLLKSRKFCATWQVNLDEGAVALAEFAEWVQRLGHSRALFR